MEATVSELSCNVVLSLPQRIAVNWRLMDDENRENSNAGNGGDLVKHTVYLTTLRFLVGQEPWNQGLLLRECHAGRGMYQIHEHDVRCRLLSCLYSSPASNEPILLQSAQRNILSQLGCWPDSVNSPQWYVGSALINAFALANPQHLHGIELYEWQPRTRRILRAALEEADVAAQLSLLSCRQKRETTSSTARLI
jgi:hypothetical protein